MAQRKTTPTVRLRRLAAELRRLRGEVGMTREEVSEQTGINSVTLYRIESAKARPQGRTLAAMLSLYEVDAETRAQLVALSKDATKQGWHQPFYSELPDEYTAYISFEAEARSMRNYESLFVPGLLQTEDYTRAVVQGVEPNIPKADAEARVQARLARQGLLTREPPLSFWAIVDEAALRRMVGGTAVMAEQYKHLIEAVSQPRVTLQIVPFAVGAHPGMPGSFVILDFADPMDTDLIYLDSMAGDLFLESEQDIQRYTTMFDNLRAVALSPSASAQLLADLADSMR
ncbi:helix-turn-helix domain-containing protein [Actinokineospora cianjurensis]|uniref:helix-turn-helix domain-containing protein n=1 Tax=Actinokineospora cianjurensis TaxID=585224 RepID=UPI000EAF65DA|nr:helix-turn-helix transcriptional regulator [Actinokineospora cianjurensis]